MKIEFKVLLYSMINNLVIAVMKIIGGLTFKLSSLFADGMHTFSDFITDIMCMIGAKISKKKPTKYHPFGFGKVEYLVNLFIGIILFILGIFIIINSFNHEAVVPPIDVLWLLVVGVILKCISIFVMHMVGKKINSQVLITSVEESKTDLYSSIGVVIITILLQFSKQYPFLKWTDMIGTIIIGLIVLKTALKVIIDNSLSLIGEVDTNKDKINKVIEVINDFDDVEDQRVTLIKYGSYYKLQLMLDLNYKLTLRQVSNLEKKIKTSILRHRTLKIKYVTIYVTNKLD